MSDGVPAVQAENETREHFDQGHGVHRIEPGIDIDMVAQGRGPDPRWCNVCGGLS